MKWKQKHKRLAYHNFHKAITTKTTILKMMIVRHAIHTVYKVCCLKKSYNKPLYIQYIKYVV